MAKAVVVVPIVSAALNPYEHIALAQLITVLGHHPLVALAPRRLRGQLPVPAGVLSETLWVDDAALESVASYNQLMLAPEFYRAFAGYEHLLIHQLDAFVFRDELAHWCAQPWDYIGPPWAYGWAFGPRHRQWDRRTQAWWSYRLQRRRGHRDRARYHALRVGNGGFSLRRIPALQAVLAAPPPLLARYRAGGLPDFPEDLFWGVDVNRDRRRLRVPDWRTALRFGVESAPAESLAALSGTPFGCHGWYKLAPEVWRPHIEVFGHRLPVTCRSPD